jgi:hypothetical protein
MALVLFWPAAFTIKGDGQTAAELARLKGERQFWRLWPRGKGTLAPLALP